MKSSIPNPALAAPDEVERNKSESAYRVLRQAILDAELAPGTPLRPSALREVYGIGWTPLREALSRLEAERLVTMQRNHGFAVAPVSVLELEDLTRARRALELALLEESVRQGDSAWEERLVVAHYRLKASVLVPGDWSQAAVRRWLDCHQAFHLALLSGWAAPWLTHLYLQVMDQERRHHCVLMFEALRQHEARTKVVDTPDGHATTAMDALSAAMDLHHHTALMEAALARNVELASSLMVEHVAFKAGVFSHAELLAPQVVAVKKTRTARTPSASLKLVQGQPCP